MYFRIPLESKFDKYTHIFEVSYTNKYKHIYVEMFKYTQSHTHTKDINIYTYIHTQSHSNIQKHTHT